MLICTSIKPDIALMQNSNQPASGIKQTTELTTKQRKTMNDCQNKQEQGTRWTTRHYGPTDLKNL